MVPLVLALLFGCTEYHVYAAPPWTPGEDPADGSMDLLLVIDNSCSMGDNWGVIWYGLTRVPEDLDGVGADAWSVALVSADPSDTAATHLGPPMDGWDMSAALDQFKATAGTVEAGLAASLPYAHPSIEMVVFVSDEDDQSQEWGGPLAWRETWGDVWTVAIVGTGGACAEEGSAYLLVADREVNICTTEPWSLVD